VKRPQLPENQAQVMSATAEQGMDGITLPPCKRVLAELSTVSHVAGHGFDRRIVLEPGFTTEHLLVQTLDPSPAGVLV